MKVIIENEIANKLWWISDLIEDSKDKSINQVFNSVKGFFGKSSNYKYGRGGHHVWISDQYNNRILLITE